MDGMQVLLTQLDVMMDEFKQEANLVKNKAAARRARKLSLSITKVLKQYRKDSSK